MLNILGKALSGRWFIVVALTTVYVYCLALSIPLNDNFYTLYGMIVVFYFSRNDREAKQ